MIIYTFFFQVKKKELEAEKKLFEDKSRKKSVPKSQKIITPISSPTSSENSAELADAGQRIRILREESKNTRLEFSPKSETSKSEESTPRVTEFKPKFTENRISFRSSRDRYQFLLEPPEETARRELIQKSSQLGYLISAMRDISPESPKSLQEIREAEKEKKLEMLMNCVRTEQYSPKLPPVPKINEILKIHQPETSGITQSAIAQDSEQSDGEITAGRVSPPDNTNFWN